MKRYLQENAARLLVAVAITGALCLGVIDPVAAGAGMFVICDTTPTDLKALNEAMQKAFVAMGENIKKVQDLAEKAREEIRTEGTLHQKTNEKLTEIGETGVKLGDDFKSLKERVQAVEQKLDHKPGNDNNQQGRSIGQMVIDSDQFKAVKAGDRKMDRVNVGSFHKTAITNVLNQTTGTIALLGTTDRLQGLIMPGLRRLTVRDLIPNYTTSGNMIEYVKENVFTNSAGPQYDATSPTPGQEGAIKNESGITFTLVQTPVTTIAHWVPASRQVLADAPQLQSYVDGRLRYGLKLEEEDELLNETGANGNLNGLMNQATAFSGGATSALVLDTFLRAFTQISLSEYEASGLVVHPTDWQNVMLLKDTTGRYLFSDPHSVEQPRVWGKTVVPTQAMAVGNFLAGAFTLAAGIYDREDADVRVAEQHADFFIRNMVVILCEERLALAVFRAAALVKGSISYAG